MMPYNVLIFGVILTITWVYFKRSNCRWKNRANRAAMLFLLLCWLSTMIWPPELFYIAPAMFLLKYPVLAIFIYSEFDHFSRLWQRITQGENTDESAKALSKSKEIPVWVARIIIFELTVISKLMFWKK